MLSYMHTTLAYKASCMASDISYALWLNISRMEGLPTNRCARVRDRGDL